MIEIKSAREIRAMRRAGRIAASALAAAGRAVQPGMTTAELNRIIHAYIVDHGAIPTFLGYSGFPAAACISINDQVIHGIPGSAKLREGDLVKIDVGATFDGYVGDCANTFPVGRVSAEAERLIAVTRQSFYEGIQFARAGQRVHDISHGVQAYAESQGCSVVRDFVGHGVGAQMHEDPEVPNFGKAGTGARLCAGMTLAVEPMINLGTFAVNISKDGWTVRTRDGSLSAHFENSILITDGDPEILTVAEED